MKYVPVRDSIKPPLQSAFPGEMINLHLEPVGQMASPSFHSHYETHTLLFSCTVHCQSSQATDTSGLYL